MFATWYDNYHSIPCPPEMVRHDSLICVTWLIDMCDVTRWYVWRDSLIYVTWLVHILEEEGAIPKTTIHCIPWLMTMCDMFDSYVWHDSFICVSWLVHLCDMTRLYSVGGGNHQETTNIACCAFHVTHMNESFHTNESVLRLIHWSHIRMTHLYVWHDSCTCVTWLMHMCDMTHSYVLPSVPPK